MPEREPDGGRQAQMLEAERQFLLVEVDQLQEQAGSLRRAALRRWCVRWSITAALLGVLLYRHPAASWFLVLVIPFAVGSLLTILFLPHRLAQSADATRRAIDKLKPE